MNTKSIQETIDEVLDNLNKKGKLSTSEKSFIAEASNGKVKSITVPEITGNFWRDMSNPHNVGILWQGSDDVWRQLKTVEEEDSDEMNKIVDMDERWRESKKRQLLRMSEAVPELKDIVNQLAVLHLGHEAAISELKKKLNIAISEKDVNLKHNILQKWDYAQKSMYSLFNQFETLLDITMDEDTGEYIKNV